MTQQPASVHEGRIERSLVAEIERFMIELGAGFAFVGRQVPLDVDGEEFFVDMRRSGSCSAPAATRRSLATR